jgi:tetratricopeptide (TPR) repeat protein
MKRAYVPFLCVLGILIQAEALSDKQMQCKKLNNEGVRAINDKDWQLAFDKFDAALKVDPEYSLARDNITVTQGQHGRQLRLEHNLAESLKELHQAAYAQPYWDQELSITIERIGKNPKSFADRVELADQASAKNDSIGAAVEYRAALQLKDDAQVHMKLGDAYNLIGEKAKATAEYDEAVKRGEQHKPSSTAP